MNDFHPSWLFKMRFWHAILGTAALASVCPLTLAIPTGELSTLQPVSTNISTGLTLPITPIDPRFGITRTIGPDTPLAQNSLLMTAVNEMAKLALRDWSGRVGSFRSSHLPGYSEVLIVIRTVRPARKIDTRIVVWGLYAAIDNMRLNHRFQVNEYQLYWDDILVGTLRFSSTVASESATGGQQSETERLDLMLPTLPSIVNPFRNGTEDNTSSADSTGSLEDFFFADCLYIQDAQPLTFEEVLVPIITALRDVAAAPKTSFMDGKFLVQPVGMDAKVLFGGRDYGPITERNTYSYEFVIRALHAIPDFFLRNNRFGEMLMHLIVNGVYVGVGGLDKRDDSASAVVSSS